MPGQQQIALLGAQVIEDVGQQFEGELRVEQRVVGLGSGERGFLILLDQMVVGVLGPGQRAQIEGIDGGKVQQPKVGRMLREHRQVVFDDVVADQAGGAGGELVEIAKCSVQPAAVALPGVGARAVAAYRADGRNGRSAFEVDGQQTPEAA